MPAARSPRILYFGIYSKGAAFPRSNNIISGLRRNGVRVMEAHVEIDGSYRRRSQAAQSIPAAIGFAVQLIFSMAVLSWKFIKTPPADVVIVGHPGYFHIHLARLLCGLTRRQTLLVYDSFIPLHDAIVKDRGLIRPASPISKLLRAFETSCLRIADRCLVDTEVNGRFAAQEFGVSIENLKTVRVGPTIRQVFSVPAMESSGNEFRVVFVGTFIPLQGIDVILEAARLLLDRTEISFTIVGSGQLGKPMRDRAASLGLSNVTFTGWLTTDQLGDVLRAHHLALGIFGTNEKALRVIPSKVYDICAAGMPFVSADTPAMQEAFTHLINAYLVPPGDPRSLAEAILHLKSNHRLRARLASAAFLTGRTAFSLDQIGRQVLAAVRTQACDHPTGSF